METIFYDIGEAMDYYVEKQTDTGTIAATFSTNWLADKHMCYDILSKYNLDNLPFIETLLLLYVFFRNLDLDTFQFNMQL